MTQAMKRVGRPPRLDERRPVPTFFPQGLRESAKRSAASVQTPMSDWISLRCNEWLALPQCNNATIYRTHPRRVDTVNWVPVQVVLAADTYEKLVDYARERDVAVASLVYTIVRWACGEVDAGMLRAASVA